MSLLVFFCENNRDYFDKYNARMKKRKHVQTFFIKYIIDVSSVDRYTMRKEGKLMIVNDLLEKAIKSE